MLVLRDGREGRTDVGTTTDAFDGTGGGTSRGLTAAGRSGRGRRGGRQERAWKQPKRCQIEFVLFDHFKTELEVLIAGLHPHEPQAGAGATGPGHNGRRDALQTDTHLLIAL